ncbi:C-X-C chemokine receptor type 1-like [Exaiptasia diaphana]|uniref:G-protein coupled receptors family 1 profile domain-containing protein n=1 Tax=Exaiptasia diaphana TaxID=2652724 RepID=A0A913XJQ2_EXADI|nr:C-X-C chemokine receptor type 1-like [Exaiptasia diaphana]
MALSSSLNTSAANTSGFYQGMNASIPRFRPPFSPILYLLFVYYAIAVLALSIISNLLALAACFKLYRRNPSVMLGYLASLSVANLCFSILGSFDFSMHFSLTGEVACKVEGFLTETCYMAAIIILVCISYERKRVVATPILARLKELHFRKLLPLLVWVFSSILCSPLLIFYTRIHGTCTSILLASISRLIFYIIQTVVVYVLSLFLMFWAHLNIFKTLSRHRTFRRGSSSAAKIFRSDAKLSRMLVAVIIVFVVCHTPYMSMLLMINFGIEERTATWQITWHIARLLMFSQTTINPFIYCFFSKQFRKTCKDILTCHCSASNLQVPRLRATSGTTSLELQAVPCYDGNGGPYEKDITEM